MDQAQRAYDVAIVGGGASGLAAALAAAAAGCRVAVVERDVACGLTILATGNGRCNLSNDRLDPARYRHPDVARAVMGPEPGRELAAFFARAGIETVSIDGRRYPYSRRAESVRDALLGACGRAGVTLLPCCDLVGARSPQGPHDPWGLRLREPVRPLRAKRAGSDHAALRAQRKALAAVERRERVLTTGAVVLATGGRGGDAARIVGAPWQEGVPVLCPVACRPAGALTAVDGALLAALDGLRADAALALYPEGRLGAVGAGDAAGSPGAAVADAPAWREEGEVLFRPWGLSGIVAFDLSRRAQPHDALEIDLFPGCGERDLAARFAARSAYVGTLAARGTAWFDGLLAPALGRVIDALVRADGGAPVAGTAPADRDVVPAVSTPVADGAVAADPLAPAAAHHAKHLRFTVMGTAEERVAQVRHGGIPFSAVDVPALRLHSTHAPRLFACGEALDMDADCGGFNLAWAWRSGTVAGANAAAAAREASS